MIEYRPLIDLLERDNNYVIGDNQPYKGYLRGDTLFTRNVTGLAARFNRD